MLRTNFWAPTADTTVAVPNIKATTPIRTYLQMLAIGTSFVMDSGCIIRLPFWIPKPAKLRR